jgi:hypothetical protein
MDCAHTTAGAAAEIARAEAANSVASRPRFKAALIMPSDFSFIVPASLRRNESSLAMVSKV